MKVVYCPKCGVINEYSQPCKISCNTCQASFSTSFAIQKSRLDFSEKLGKIKNNEMIINENYHSEILDTSAKLSEAKVIHCHSGFDNIPEPDVTCIDLETFQKPNSTPKPDVLFTDVETFPKSDPISEPDVTCVDLETFQSLNASTLEPDITCADFNTFANLNGASTCEVDVTCIDPETFVGEGNSSVVSPNARTVANSSIAPSQSTNPNANTATEKSAENRAKEIRTKITKSFKGIEQINWKIGDVVLGNYQILGELGAGGFSKIYKVYHKLWDIEIAMKTPRLDRIKTEKDRNNFEREAKNWVNLDMYPHIVTCYYVQTIEQIPILFSEYIDGTTLSHYIYDRSKNEPGLLYKGSQEEVLAKIFDILIQISWGLSYSHNQNLIHQDVKSANIMINQNGVVKITDFGLSNFTGDMDKEGQENKIINGLTPAYCSPEQYERKQLTLHTDIWSWGLIALEMFYGRLNWKIGILAPELLSGYLKNPSKPLPMPESLANLLNKCFAYELGKRPQNFAEIAQKLIEIYPQVFSHSYERLPPKKLDTKADILNNRALSLLDLGQVNSAKEYLKQALEADTHHLHACYNYGLICWREGKMTSAQFIQRLKAVYVSRKNNWQDWYFLGLVYKEQGNIELSRETMNKGLANIKDSTEQAQNVIQRELSNLENNYELLSTLQGHTSSIHAVVISGNGETILSAGSDGLIKVWNTYDSECVGIMKGHNGAVKCILVNFNGTFAISGGDDHSIRVWDVTNKTCIQVLKGHTDAVNEVIVQNNLLASASDDKTVRIWNINSKSCIGVLRGDRGYINSVALFLKRFYIATAGDEGVIKIRNLKTGKYLQTLKGHKEPIYALAFAKNGSTLLSGGADNVVRAWDISTGKCQEVFKGHSSYVRSIAVHDNILLSASSDKTVRIWNIDTNCCLATLEGHSGYVSSVSIEQSGCIAVSASNDGKLLTWQLKLAKAPWMLVRPRDSEDLQEKQCGFSAAIHSAQEALHQRQWNQVVTAIQKARSISGYEKHSKCLKIWQKVSRYALKGSLTGAWQELKLIGHSSWVKYVAIANYANIAVSAGNAKELRIWNTTTGECKQIIHAHSSWIRGLCLSNYDKWIISGSVDKYLRIWDIESGQKLAEYKQEYPIHAITSTPDGRLALVACSDKTIKVWHIPSNSFVGLLKGHSEEITSVAVTADSRYAVSGSVDKTVRFWDLVSGKCTHVYKGHKSAVTSVAISPGGETIVSGSEDRSVRIWDNNGKQKFIFEEHSDKVTSVILTLDSRIAVSTSIDQTIRIWNLHTQENVKTIEGHNGAISCLAITHDSTKLISASDDKTLNIVHLDWELLPKETTYWHESVKPWLELFLMSKVPAPITKNFKSFYDLARIGKAKWSQEDFKLFIQQLRFLGYGWIQKKGIYKKLEKMNETEDFSQDIPFDGNKSALAKLLWPKEQEITNKFLADRIKVVAELEEGLKHKDPHVREASAIGLGEFGKKAKRSVPLLQCALRDKNQNVVKAVKNALQKIC